MRRKLNLSLRSRYLTLYLILLALPIFILSYIIHFRLIPFLQQEIKTNSMNEVMQVQELMDAEWRNLFNISYDISYNSNFSPNILTDYNKVRIAQQDLNFKFFDPYIYDLLYYSREEGFLFSATSSYSVNYFTEKYYQFEDWSNEEFVGNLNNIEKQFVRPAENVKPLNEESISLITYVMPIPVNSHNPHGTLMFFIEEEKINNLFSNIAENEVGFSFVLSKDGQILASYNDNDITPEPILEIITQNENIFHSININNQPYFTTTVTSTFNNDWYYVSAVPESQLMNTVNEIRNTVFISYLIIMIFGLTVIYYAMKVNYLPLRKLLSRFSSKNDTIQFGNDFDPIYDAFDKTEKINQNLEKRIEENKPIIQQHLLISLISGQMESFSEFNELATEYSLAFNEKDYYVVLFDIENSSLTNIEKNRKVNQWLNHLPNAEKHTLYLMETSLIAAIISGTPNVSQLSSWFRKILENEEFTVTVGVGTSYDKATGIGRSHLEAHAALEYRVIKGHGKLLFFENLTLNDENISWYDKHTVEEIGYFIRNHEKDELEKSINKLLEIIQRDSTDLFMAKSLFFELSSMLMRLADEVRLINQEEAANIPDIIQISDFNSIDEIEDTIYLMVSKVYNIYNNLEDSKENDLINQIIQYLQENFTNNQFSTAQLAEHFDLSEAHLMRYFKKHTNKTILQYLTNLRIDYAKHLLLTTEKPIKDIVPKIGYIDVSSFIRRFKRETNLTPGQYRKKHQE